MTIDWLSEEIENLQKRLKKQPRSPLFAQLAAYLLQTGRTEEALKVCDEGLTHHPHYTTAHLVRGKVLLAMKMKAEARREFEFVNSRLPGIESVVALYEQVAAAVESETIVEPAPTKTVRVTKVGAKPQPLEQPFAAEEPAVPQAEEPEVPEPTVESTPVATEELTPILRIGAESEAATEEQQESVQLTVEETYEEFAARMRAEFAGTENTLTMEEYLSGNPSGQPAAGSGNAIEELAEKLQSAPKIAPPVIDLSQRATKTATEEASSGPAGFVTPTLAEIYVKQGWYDDAIRAYKSLAATKPEQREEFEKRIREVEEMKKEAGL
jgi:tetratricopeptide (TPR) repeat protein